MLRAGRGLRRNRLTEGVFVKMAITSFREGTTKMNANYKCLHNMSWSTYALFNIDYQWPNVEQQRLPEWEPPQAGRVVQ